MDAIAPAGLRTPLWLAIACVAVTIAGTTWTAWDMFGDAQRPMLQGWDDSFYYFWLPSAVIDRDLDFTNQVTGGGTLDATAQSEALAQPRTPTGLLPNKYPPGWALGSLPFFLVAHAVAAPGATGFEPIYLLSVWFGQWLYAIVGLWLAIRIAARFFPARLATVAVLTTWLASPLVYYQGARLAMSHSQVFALAMIAFWSALRIHEGDARARQWLLCGFASALLVVTRNVALVYLAWPAWGLLRKLRSLPAAGGLVLGAAGPIVVQLAAWKILYGAWFVYSYGGERFDFTQLHLTEVLFSPRHGWFYWHPLLLTGVVGFLAWCWTRAEGRAWFVSLLLIVVLHAAWPTWWLGSSFGYRGFEVPVLFSALGIARGLQWIATYRSLRRAASLLLTFGVSWNLLLLALFLTHRIPRDSPVTYTDAARAAIEWIASGQTARTP